MANVAGKPDVIDAVKAGRQCIGAEYRFWGGGNLEAWSPEYVDAPGLTPEYVVANGCNCSGLINVVRRFVLGDSAFFAGTEGYADFLKPWENWDSSKYYPVGTLLLEPYVEGVSEGHIAMVSKPDQTILQSTSWYGGGYPGVTEDRTSWDQAIWTPWSYAGFMPDLLPPEGGGPLDPGTGGSTTIPTRYPGDTATPLQMAAWFDYVSRTEFGIDGILPVTCSATELTQAWTGPGNVHDVPGYDYAVDHASVGWFQQQVGIWDGGQPGIGATYDQIMNPEWSLRSFLTVAEEYKGTFSQTDPGSIGQWCQAVQNSGVPDAYVERGYPIAGALMDQVHALPQPDTPVVVGGDMAFGKYSYAAVGEPYIDFANASVVALESQGLDAMALNGTENIKAAADTALATNDLSKANVLVIGKEAHNALSAAAQQKDTWTQDDPLWSLTGDSDAATLKRVRDWALSWVASYEKKDAEKLQGIFDGVLMAIDPKRYGDLLAEAEQGDHPDPPPPPDPSLEQKVNIMWAEYKKEHAS